MILPYSNHLVLTVFLKFQKLAVAKELKMCKIAERGTKIDIKNGPVTRKGGVTILPDPF